MPATRNGTAYEFEIADLDAYRARSSRAVAGVAAVVQGQQAAGVSAQVVTAPGPLGDTDRTVRELTVEAARERALTAKLTAEVERLRAERTRDELLREHQARDRSHRIRDLVEKACRHVAEGERGRLETRLQAALDGVDLESRLGVAAIVQRAIAEAQQAHAARQDAVSRMPEAGPASKPPVPTWRDVQIQGLVAVVAGELQAFSVPADAIALAVRAAADQLGQVDDLALADGAWATHVARSAASWVLGGRSS